MPKPANIVEAYLSTTSASDPRKIYKFVRRPHSAPRDIVSWRRVRGIYSRNPRFWNFTRHEALGCNMYKAIALATMNHIIKADPSSNRAP